MTLISEVESHIPMSNICHVLNTSVDELTSIGIAILEVLEATFNEMEIAAMREKCLLEGALPTELAVRAARALRL